MELLERNPFLMVAGLEVERVSCTPVNAPAEAADPDVRGNLATYSGGIEEDQLAEDDLDEPESGLYLCRWPNGDFSVVKADNKREAIVELDQWAGADPEWLVPIDSWMVDFRLNDRGEIELVDFGEETADLVWECCYPELDAVVSAIDVHRNDEGGMAAEAAENIRAAVQHEKTRLWKAQNVGAPAKTEVGRELQKRLGTVGPVADRYVELAAREILRRGTVKDRKPN